jgi:hypothetical protein
MSRDQKRKTAHLRLGRDSGGGGGSGGGTSDKSPEILERIRKMIRPELPLEILERVNYKVLVKTTENQSSTTGRPKTEHGKQADHTTAYTVLVYGITNPFYRVSTSIEEKRKELYDFVKRLSVLALRGPDNEVLKILITKIDEALTEYNDSRLLKRSENILNEVFSDSGIHLTAQLNKLQSERIKTILVEKEKVVADIKTVIPKIINLFCKDDSPRTDGKEIELKNQLLQAIDHEDFQHDAPTDKKVEIISDILDEVGLSYVKAYEHQEKTAQKLRILKIRNLCQNVSAAALEYYNNLREIAFIQCPKVPVIKHGDNKKVLEKEAIRSMNQRYLGKNRYNTDSSFLVATNLKTEIQKIMDAIDELEEMVAKKNQKSKATSSTAGGSADVSAGSCVSASNQEPPKKKIRMTGEFKKLRDQLKKQLEVLQANRPESVARDIYGLLDYRKVAELTAVQATTSGGGGGAKASSEIGVRNNDKGTLYSVLARHLYLILTVYPQAGLQYGYDITDKNSDIRRFREAVLTPFFSCICADWEIDDETDIDEVTQAVLTQLKSLLNKSCDHELESIIDSKQSSGNASEAGEDAASGDDSDTGSAVTGKRESDDDQEGSVLTGMGL